MFIWEDEGGYVWNIKITKHKDALFIDTLKK
jgi:hypothetical protein